PARWPTGNRSRRRSTGSAEVTPSGSCSRNRWSPVISRSSATTMRCASCGGGSSSARRHATYAGSTGRGCHDRVCYASATRCLGGDQTMIDGNTIRHLWTHKTQDHPWLSDEELVIDRAEGVWVWTQTGKKLLDGFAGLAVVNVGHGRREIAEAIAEQTVKLAYYPTTRKFPNRPAAELAVKLAALTPGDLTYTMFAVSGSEANERSMQIARHYWLRKGRPGKHKVIALQGGYHGATTGTFAVSRPPPIAQPSSPPHRPPLPHPSPPASPRAAPRRWRRLAPSAPAAPAATRSWCSAGPPNCARRSSAKTRRPSPP